MKCYFKGCNEQAREYKPIGLKKESSDTLVSCMEHRPMGWSRSEWLNSNGDFVELFGEVENDLQQV